MRKSFLLALFLCLVSFTWAQAQKGSPIGTWVNADGKAHIEIYQNGDKLFGKIVWLKEPNRNGKPKQDMHNPDPKLQQRPILGMVMLRDFEPAGNGKWEDGKIYDPESGKEYSCYMKMLGADKMEVKGYIGISLIGRSQTWTRVK